MKTLKDRHEGNFSATAGITILGSKMFVWQSLQPKEMKLNALTQHKSKIKNHLQARMVPRHARSTAGWDMMCPKPVKKQKWSPDLPQGEGIV